MTRANKHENFLIDKIDKKHTGVVPTLAPKAQQFARKTNLSKTHIVSVTVKRRRKVA